MNLPALFSLRTRLLIIAWIIILIFVVLEMYTVQFYRPDLARTPAFMVMYLVKQSLLGVLLIIALILPGYKLIKRTFRHWSGRLAGYLLHLLLFGSVYFAILVLLDEWERNGAITSGYLNGLMYLTFTESHNAVKTYLTWIAILYGMDYYEKSLAAALRQKSLENEMNNIKLQSLRAQLQPHFLFNALNNVVALIDENKRKAQQSLIHLSDLLRYTIQLEPHRLVPIAEEVQTIRTYLAIEQSKYEDQLHVEWDLPSPLPHWQVPPLIIQPLVENAIKHGFKDHEGPLRVRIYIKKGLIRIQNNGHPLTGAIQKNQGLGIVEKRLRIHFGDTVHLVLSQKEDWVTHTIQWYEAM